MLKAFLSFPLLALLLSACSNPIDQRLVEASLCMENHPDSAWTLLSHIPHPEAMNKASRAEYALLFTQAQAKNNIIATNDSLIRVAVDYYKGGNDRMREALSYYYLGNVYQDMEMSTEAIEALLKASRSMPDTAANSRRIMLINYHLSALYEEQGYYDKALEAARKAYNYCARYNNPNDLMEIQRSIGGIFLFKDQPDSALVYYNHALVVARQEMDSSAVSTILCDLARIYDDKNDLPIAYQYISESIKIAPQGYELHPTFFLMGKILIQLKKNDSARYYLYKSKDSPDLYTQTGSFHQMYLLEKQEGFCDKAIEYNDLFAALNDSISSRKRRLVINQLVNDHTIALHTNRLIAAQQKTDLLIIILIVLILGIGVSLYLLYDRKRKKHIINLYSKLMRNRSAILMAHSALDEDELGKEGISILDVDCVNKLKEEKFSLCTLLLKENKCYPLLESFHKTRKKEKVLSSSDKYFLETTILELFVDVATAMKEQFDTLTEKDIYCCILYRLGYKSVEVSELMSSSLDTLRVRRSRIRNKVDKNFYADFFSNTQTTK